MLRAAVFSLWYKYKMYTSLGLLMPCYRVGEMFREIRRYCSRSVVEEVAAAAVTTVAGCLYR